MREINRDAEELRSKLLSEVYAGAVPGMPAMIRILKSERKQYFRGLFNRKIKIAGIFSI